MNKNKVRAILFGCISVGALNETIVIFGDPDNVGTWKAKAIASVVTLIALFFTGYFWRKSITQG
ncbi:MAG: hypothetical protein V4616_13025 [Bacteroidota bacterium]